MTAQEAYNKEIEEMKEQIARLQKQVKAAEKINIRGNWGYVGTAKEVNRLLDEVLVVMK